MILRALRWLRRQIAGVLYLVGTLAVWAACTWAGEAMDRAHVHDPVADLIPSWPGWAATGLVVGMVLTYTWMLVVLALWRLLHYAGEFAGVSLWQASRYLHE